MAIHRFPTTHNTESFLNNIQKSFVTIRVIPFQKLLSYTYSLQTIFRHESTQSEPRPCVFPPHSPLAKTRRRRKRRIWQSAEERQRQTEGPEPTKANDDARWIIQHAAGQGGALFAAADWPTVWDMCGNVWDVVMRRLPCWEETATASAWTAVIPRV